ncbi:MAG: ORF6N domain-containing protein [Pasteurella sp.]|nr:ORF6N domain-containing protein [Pasteurella sp.]
MKQLQVINIESKLIQYQNKPVLVDRDIADLYGVTTREINQAVSNNLDKFPDGYIFQIDKEMKNELVKNFDRFNSLKHSSVNPKVFTEKGLYMLATIIKSPLATQTTLQIIETFAKLRELSRNINAIMKTTDENKQNELANHSNKILEEIIDIDAETFDDENEGEIIETTTKFEFSLGFAKVSRSVKKITK